jgi:hypothetical protein
MKQSGWLTFAAVVLLFTGIMRVLDGIWALIHNGPVVDGLHDAIFGHSLTVYGIIWLIVGAILIFSGSILLNPIGVTGQIARWIGIVAAAILAITSIAWMPYYPVWSLVYIAIAVAVIYGLTAHYDEAAVTSAEVGGSAGTPPPN